MTNASDDNYSFMFNCLAAITAAAVAFTVLAAMAASAAMVSVGLFATTLAGTALFISILCCMGGSQNSSCSGSYYPPVNRTTGYGLFNSGYTTTTSVTSPHYPTHSQSSHYHTHSPAPASHVHTHSPADHSGHHMHGHH